MSIPYGKIEELIEAARLCQEKLPLEEQYLHYSDIQATLQKLIDDDLAEREKFEENELDAMRGVWDEAGFIEPTKEELNELDAMRQDKQSDWPHGI